MCRWHQGQKSTVYRGEGTAAEAGEEAMLTRVRAESTHNSLLTSQVCPFILRSPNQDKFNRGKQKMGAGRGGRGVCSMWPYWDDEQKETPKPWHEVCLNRRQGGIHS